MMVWLVKDQQNPITGDLHQMNSKFRKMSVERLRNVARRQNADGVSSREELVRRTQVKLTKQMHSFVRTVVLPSLSADVMELVRSELIG